MSEETTTPAIDIEAQRLIVRGFLPPPHIISPFDSRPLWDYLGLCALLDQRPSELTEILLRNGPVHLAGDKGIPSSWRMLIEG